MSCREWEAAPFGEVAGLLDGECACLQGSGSERFSDKWKPGIRPAKASAKALAPGSTD